MQNQETLIRSGATLVVALGGNALIEPDGEYTISAQAAAARRAMQSITPLVQRGHPLVITHGNGFQVGNILAQAEAALGKASGLPLDVCVAESQGEIGYLLEQTLQNALVERGLEKCVVSILTQVIVDENDPAFQHPTKPIGPYLEDADADKLRRRGFHLVHEDTRGWRKVVPSPLPLAIDDAGIIRLLLQNDVIVVAAGGGGVPVVRREDGCLQGVDAVIDKDRASAMLARGIDAEHLIILTGEDCVYLDYRSSHQSSLGHLSSVQARRHFAAGQFPPGSMGPKVEAAVQFVEGGGRSALITSARALEAALSGEAGTWFE